LTAITIQKRREILSAIIEKKGEQNIDSSYRKEVKTKY